MRKDDIFQWTFHYPTRVCAILSGTVLTRTGTQVTQKDRSIFVCFGFDIPPSCVCVRGEGVFAFLHKDYLATPGQH